MPPDLLSELRPQLVTEPYAAYHRLRAEDPVHWSPSWEAWFLTRYDDVAAVKRDARFSVAGVHDFCAPRLAPETPYDLTRMEQTLGSWLLFTDPPRHTRLRALISRSFTPATISRMEVAVEARVEQLLDRLEGRRGVVDLMPDLAARLPVMTIVDLLGGDERDADELQGWSHHLATFLGTDALTADHATAADRSLDGMEAYFRPLIAARHERPKDDLISTMLDAREDQERLQDGEILAMCTLLFAAGHDTTTNLIGNSLRALLLHPEAWQALVAAPERIETAVEEILRWDSPSQITSRNTLEDVEMRGRVMRRGCRVNLCVGAANHDPEAFADPDRFDIERQDARHLSFGKGIHHCIGAFLARLEARVAVRSVLRRWPHMRLYGTLQHYPTVGFRRLRHLPVKLYPIPGTKGS